MNDSCARFLHRALPRPRAGSDKLTSAGPGLALNSTCGIRPHFRRVANASPPETPLSLLWMRDGVVPLTYGVPPPGIACGVSAYAPPPHAIETVLPFHSSSLIPRRSRHVFRPRCLSSASIQNPLQETRPRTTFTKLRDRILATKIVYVHDTIVRASSLAVLATCTVRNVHAF